MNYSDEKIRNILVQILLFCNETEIGCFINVFEDLEQLYLKYSPDLQQLFEAAEEKTEYCKKLDVLKLSPNDR